MILRTFDGKEIYVTQAQADNIAQATATGAKMIKIDSAYIAAGAIATILPGGVDPHLKTLPPPEAPQISSEQRERNIARLQEMKRDFMERYIQKQA